MLTDSQRQKLKALMVISVECMPEHMDVRGNVLASGDDAEDKRAEDEVLRQLHAGNEWAWCCIKVTATYGYFEGTDFLGGCSYKSKADFIESDDYYADMVDRAFNELVARIEKAQTKLEELE